MNEELLPDAVAISVIPSSSSNNSGGHQITLSSTFSTSSAPSATTLINPTSLQREVIVEEEQSSKKNKTSLKNITVNISSNISNTTGTGSVQQQQRRTSLVRPRKKSRKLTLTQVCSEEATLNSPSIKAEKAAETPVEPAPPTDDDRQSNCSSLMSFDSVKSLSSSSSAMSTTSSSMGANITGPERKISRIFSMLQTMQNTFLQQQQQQQQQLQQQQQQVQPPLQQQQPQQEIIEEQQPPPQVHMAQSNYAESTQHSDQCKINTLRRQQLNLDLQNPTAPSRQLLYGLGRSQDSLMSMKTGSIANAVLARNSRLGSGAGSSWAGSQCSGFTCTTITSDEQHPPSSNHNLPFHKDGWTSLFIVGSSTYAQLLIVICIVAALSEVVTHNVPFLYFEGFFAYLYTVSIIFFLYVFGYLLRSKRRQEEKKRLRKMSKWRESNMSTTSRSTETETASYRSRNASISMENEVVTTPSALNRFIDSIRGQRRRFSRTDSVSELDDASLAKAVSQNPHPNKSFQWMPSSVSFSLVDESPSSDAISYAMNSNNVLSNPESNGAHRKGKKMKVSDNEHSHGSFFLRVGAVAFGLGTMIYDGLEFGAFLEIPPDSPCFALLRGFNPILHAAFVFLQMYFIFVSARLNIHKFKAIARFGLMHCLATNVCVWVRTLVRESLKEINGHYHHYEKNHQQPQHDGDHAVSASGTMNTYASASDALLHHITGAVVAATSGNNDEDNGSSSIEINAAGINETVAEVVQAAVESIKDGKSLWELTGNVSCGRRIFLGDLIMEAAPFLYPFLIEYSLIGAAVLYVIWTQVGSNPKYKTEENRIEDSIWNSKSRQLRVDCVGASKGLFIGLFFLTASLLCLVLFFIFAPQPQFHRLGLFLADAAHCTLLIVSLFAMAIGAYRTRHLQFHSEHMEELGSILLRVSALGIFAYSVFSMIAGALAGASEHEPPVLVLINGLLSVIEVTVQMLFISDMSRRRVSTIEQDRVKPGRQAVTFLLITNMTLWLVYTFEMQKVEANPVQLNFYGFLPWAIVQRITLPLCIFYRFHSAIVYAEIWKNSYRYHGPPAEPLPQQYMVS